VPKKEIDELYLNSPYYLAAQKLEHYEIAAYGTVAALAGQLDLRDDQQMLHESLEEEKQADVRLTKLAKREVNPDALAA
jgi:ferritin-like metal-binding protein YciE